MKGESCFAQVEIVKNNQLICKENNIISSLCFGIEVQIMYNF